MAKATQKGAEAVAEAAVQSPEDVAAKAAAERKAAIDRIAESVPAGCSVDMNETEMWGRVLQRLNEWGATDAEVAAVMPKAREIAAAQAKKNADALNRRRQLRALRDAGSYEELLKGL